MQTLIVTLHVLTVVFLIGPLALAPFVGLRAVVRRDPDAVHRAVRATLVLAGASALVLLLGLAATANSGRFSYGTPWITIAITLSVIAIAAAAGVTAPSLRSIATVIEEGANHMDDQSRARLDALRGRVVATAGLAALAWAVVAVLMVVKPFD
ncbi:MAG: DUF2269 family protein [Micromonosporaceae bacterium]